jgi:hypothetical protein
MALFVLQGVEQGKGKTKYAICAAGLEFFERGLLFIFLRLD